LPRDEQKAAVTARTEGLNHCQRRHGENANSAPDQWHFCVALDINVKHYNI
jgi:hypothetical protein